MKTIETNNSFVHFGPKGYEELNKLLTGSNYSRIFVIVDSNTHEFCLSHFLSQLNQDTSDIEIIEFEAGETQKTIDTCFQIWGALSDLEADRKSLVINLGGGVVTDLGGFVACTYKRGIDYVNVPTSLLAMVDASVGGKTGVDLGSLKNQIGVISEGRMVVLDTDFLSTLPKNHMISGMAEMLKHGLISNRSYWNKLKDLNELTLSDLDDLIHESVEIKNNIVSQDQNEQGIRKSLNFGHTLGHAIETYFLESEHKADLLHGEAIAIGMILESYLSFKLNSLNRDDLNDIKSHFIGLYKPVSFEANDIKEILSLLKHDKKNSHGLIKFALLEKLGKIQLDCIVENKMIYDAFEFYQT